MGCDIHMLVQKNGKTIDVPVYKDRDYSLFAALAGVRNYDDIVPIMPPRGLPNDLDLTRNELDKRIGYPEHSFGWLTLDELEAYDWSRPTTVHASVDVGQFKEWQANGKPSEWSRLSMGWSIIYVSIEEMTRRVTEDDWSPTTEQAAHIEEGLEILIPSARIEVRRGPLQRTLEGDSKNYRTNVEWTEPLRDRIGNEWFDFMRRLREVGDGVRIVFGFDS